MVPGPDSSAPILLGIVGSRVVFAAYDGPPGGGGMPRLFATDGVVIRPLIPLDHPRRPEVQPTADSAVVWQGRLYFAARQPDNVLSFDLWSTDGTLAGTRRVADLPDISVSFSPAFVDRMRATANGVVFVYKTDAEGFEPWLSDGTAAGTLVVPVKPGPGGSMFAANEMVSDGERAWFAADDGVHGIELWTTDGTPGGTFLTSDLVPGSASSSPRNLQVFQAGVGFTTITAAPGGGSTAHGTWVNDGTTNTVQIAPPSAFLSPAFSCIGSADSDVLYLGKRPSQGSPFFVELWRTDGTAAGTTFVLGAPQGLTFFDRDFTYFGPQRIVVGADGGDGVEPWVTDGTPAGTRQLAEVWPGPSGSWPESFVSIDDELLLFVANDGTNGIEPHVIPFDQLR